LVGLLSFADFFILFYIREKRRKRKKNKMAKKETFHPSL
jgi:hypothetical protein